MQLDRRDIERALESKLKFKRLAGDHRIFVLDEGGKLLKTKTSHGTGHKAIGDLLISQMAKQLFVPRQFFIEMVRCTKTRMDYLRLLASRGIIFEDASG